jgi:hypothetical protein
LYSVVLISWFLVLCCYCYKSFSLLRFCFVLRTLFIPTHKCMITYLYCLFIWHLSLYSVTRNYFENLVRALETGLNDVGPSTSHGASSKSTATKSLGSKSKSGKNRASSTSTKSGRGVDDSNVWTCDQCTFANPKSAKACQACDRQHR